MKSWLSISAYTCEVAGVRSQGIDFRVRYFECEYEWQVEDFLRNETPQEYLNCDGELVRWSFARIFAIDEYRPSAHGDEVIGFISCLKELNEDLA